MRFIGILIVILNVSCGAPKPPVYSFFVAGHTYGKAGVNNEGLHPPFKAEFPYIKSRPEVKFGVLTGDIVAPKPLLKDWIEVDADVKTLGVPVYFAVGNHDMENRPIYEERYGTTYQQFIQHNDLFIILDPNIDHWNITGEQLAFLKKTVEENKNNVDNIYVFFHQLLWKKTNSKYEKIRTNSSSGRAAKINFWTTIEPIFHGLPNQVFMFAGDLGAGSWANNLFYDQYDNITLVASGMGDGDGDNYIIVNVDENKLVTYDLICLNKEDQLCTKDLVDYKLTD